MTQKKTTDNMPVEDKKEVEITSTDEVIMSYIMTLAKRDFGVIGERFLLHLMKMAQRDVEGLNFKDGTALREIRPSLEYVKRDSAGNAYVTIPISALMNEGERNYSFVRSSIEALQKHIISWEVERKDERGNPVVKNGKNVKDWYKCQLVGKVRGSTDRGDIDVMVDVDIWTAMTNFKMGFRAIDMNIAKKFKSRYSLRIYEILCRQKNNITYDYDDLRERLCGGKYERGCDFKRSVLDPAKKELDAKSPMTFDYIFHRSEEGGRGGKKITSVTFIPKRQIQFDTTRTENGFDRTFMLLGRDICNVLQEYGFMALEINRNFDLFYPAKKQMTGADEKHPTLLKFLLSLSRNMMMGKDANGNVIKNKSGYVIGSLKIHLKEVYGITYKSQKQMMEEKKVIAEAERRRKESKESKEPKSLFDIVKGNE